MERDYEMIGQAAEFLIIMSLSSLAPRQLVSFH